MSEHDSVSSTESQNKGKNRPSDKDLRNLHPLYSRLSGESLWLLMEDAGFDAESIDHFMDVLIRAMHADLKVMRRILKDKDSWLKLEVPEALTACEKCAGMHNALIPASHSSILNFLPPFGIGCPVSARAMSYEEATQLSLKLGKNLEDMLPKIHPKESLCCEIFFKTTACPA